MVPNIILEEDEEDGFHQWADQYDQWDNTPYTPVEEDDVGGFHLEYKDTIYGSAKSWSDEDDMLWHRLFYTNEDLKNYSCIDTGASIPISTCKLTKNCSHIVSGASIPSHSLYSGNNQRFRLDVESPSLPEKDIEKFYCLVARLLFTRKIARPDIQACVAYIFTRMKLPMNYHQNRHLNINILLVNKAQIFLMLPLKERYMHFETLFSKHKKYILNILQQLVQLQRLKNVFTVVEKLSRIWVIRYKVIYIQI